MPNSPNQSATPKRPRSEAQKAAARRNGAKSKGPVTAMGKKISSRNALRHGLEASDISLTSENPEAFSQVLSEYMDEYRPVGPTETTLVEHLAIAHFRLYRAWTSETALYNIEMAENDERLTKKYTYMAHPVRTADATETMLARSNALPHVYRCQAAVNREYYRALNKLLDLRKPPKAPRKTASKTPEIAETNPDISLERHESEAPEPGQPSQCGQFEPSQTGSHPVLSAVVLLLVCAISFAATDGAFRTFKLRKDVSAHFSPAATHTPKRGNKPSYFVGNTGSRTARALVRTRYLDKPENPRRVKIPQPMIRNTRIAALHNPKLTVAPESALTAARLTPSSDADSTQEKEVQTSQSLANATPTAAKHRETSQETEGVAQLVFDEAPVASGSTAVERIVAARFLTIKTFQRTCMSSSCRTGNMRPLAAFEA
jgi:hypothetical protein